MTSWNRAGLVVGVMIVAACSDGGTGPAEQEAGTLTVDASTTWAYVRLGDTAEGVTVATPATSSSWDLAFFGTGVMLNGGAAGPAGVIGYCVCQNTGLSNAQVLGLTSSSGQAAFDGVTAASLPAHDSAWTSDALTPAISGWYSYNIATHQVSADGTKVWKIRMAEAANPGYAKFRVVSLENATRTTAGRVRIEYAVQPALGGAMGATQTAVLDATAGGRVYFDFARGSVSDATDWDIALEGFAIRINSGASGSGGAGAVLASESFAEMMDASDAPAQIYKSDAYGGVFDAHRWYRYNLTGNHDITPTYDVYLIKRGSEVYKVQLISYYDAAGQSRRITFRYAKLAE